MLSTQRIPPSRSVLSLKTLTRRKSDTLSQS
jgi:hypothetical protein